MSEIKKEIARKSIHFTGLIYIPAYIYLGREVVLLGIFAALTFSAVFEVLRLKYGLLGAIAREYERNKIGAYIYFGIAAFFVTLFFPVDACFASILVSILGDGVGGIIKRLNFPHSRLSATIVMFLLPFLVSLLLLKPFPSLVACSAGAMVERIERVRGHYLQDNITVPITAAVAYYSVNYFLP
ncbi:diacylglycerol/polyprenol kinase family protein [Archaeoglobus neptunius]|uniref:diacylglycerol/polyprenol kinase family protein n=1 Tax=Archaeoglobus neptunius TaxID=2798580 RepID=UPI0019282D30|nr:hypothetical protein [Archaeoglobus neptunius]